MKLSHLITVPVGILLIAFAIANRRAVPLSFDPFSQDTPALTIALPLWAIAFGAFVAGIVLGGLTAWVTRLHRHLRRGWHRRSLAKAERAAARAREDDPLADLPAITPRPTALPAPRRSLLRRKSEPVRTAG